MTKPADQLKLTVDEKRCKFLFQVRHADLQQWEKPPLHLIEMAVRQLMENRFPQRLKHYQFFGERLKAVWNALPRAAENKTVQIVVGEFYPELPGFVADLDTTHNDQILITLPFKPELVHRWHPACLEAAVNLKLSYLGLSSRVNPAQIRMMYSRAAHFREPIVNYPLSTSPRSHPGKSGKDFQILVHPQRLEYEILIGSLRAMLELDAEKRLFDEIDQALWKFSHSAGRSPFLKDFRKLIRKSVETGLEQIQSLGLEMPLILPGGYFVRDDSTAPRLSELKTLTAYLQIRKDPPSTDQSSYFSQDEMQERKDMLSDRSIPGAASLFPVTSLTAQEPEVVGDFLAFAKFGRSHYLSSQRELQALIFNLPANRADAYGKDLETFWFEFVKTFGTNQGSGLPVTIISHFFPMSVNAQERKPLARGRKVQDHDHAAWLPMIVREIIALPSIPADSAVIAASLAPNVSEAAVKKALDSLLSMGMISYDSNMRRYQQREKNVVTGDEKPSERILRIHDEMSDLAAAVLDNPPESMRSTAMNFLIDPAQFEAAKQKIREWLHGLLDRSAKERDPDQLFQISLQMYQGPF